MLRSSWRSSNKIKESSKWETTPSSKTNRWCKRQWQRQRLKSETRLIGCGHRHWQRQTLANASTPAARLQRRKWKRTKKLEIVKEEDRLTMRWINKPTSQPSQAWKHRWDLDSFWMFFFTNFFLMATMFWRNSCCSRWCLMVDAAAASWFREEQEQEVLVVVVVIVAVDKW